MKSENFARTECKSQRLNRLTPKGLTEKMRLAAKDVRPPYALRIRMQDLKLGPRSTHPRSDPPDAGPDYLELTLPFSVSWRVLCSRRPC